MAGHYINTIEDQVTGKPVNGAVIKVYQDGATIVGDAVTSGTLETIFSDDGVTTINQTTAPLTTGTDGEFDFYTNATRVIVAVLVNDSGVAVWNDVDIPGSGLAGDITTLTARVDKHDTVFGLAASAVDLGTFTGTTIADNVAVKVALQSLETAVEASALDGAITASGLTMATARLLGRTTASTGAVEELTAGTGLTLSAGSLAVNQSAVKPTESLIIAASDETTALTTGTAKVTFRMPYAFTLTAVRASVTTAPTGAVLTVDINEGGVSVLSTKLTIDISEKTSTTAATPAVISDSALADDAEITIDIDQIGSTIAGAGLKVALIGTRT